MNNKEAIERLNFVQEAVYCIRNTFNQDTESDKLIRNCMALLQNAIDGEYHDMEEVDVSKIKRPQGEWIVGEYMDCHSDILPQYTCPFCGEVEYRKYDYCPYCGAVMEKEE